MAKISILGVANLATPMKKALHPETAHGANTTESGQVGQPSFAEDQSEKSGESDRTVRRNTERGDKITEGNIRYLECHATNRETPRSHINP